MKKLNSKEPWQKALVVLIQLEVAQKKLGSYLESFERDDSWYAVCRAYVLNVVKHRQLLEYFLKIHAQKMPQRELKCFLLLVLGQLWQKFLNKNLSKDDVAPLINGWIERSKELFVSPECKFINAILRKVLPFFENVNTLPWTVRYNMPAFLIERYRPYYGKANLQKYLQWNEGFSKIYIRTNEKIDGLKSTQWEGFFELTDKVRWQDVLTVLQAGKAYIQDPMTRIPVEQLNVQLGNNILDLCAAPGGKTVQIAQKLQQTGCIVAVDLPNHMKRLQANTKFYPQVHLMGKDVLELQEEDFSKNELPSSYDRVLIDVPCSNTGVIRRKPDVLNRLSPSDFEILPKIQFELLCKASKFVRKEGLLVYSTCSIDPEENEGVVKSFLEQHKNFILLSSHISFPWIDGHDGGGAFCLKKC